MNKTESSSLLLSESELEELVGSPRVCSQIEWLTKNRWRYVLSRTGRPRVSRAFAMAVLGSSTTQASPTEPIWSTEAR